MKHKIFLAITLMIVSLGFAMTASAQKKGTDWRGLAEAAKRGQAKIDRAIAARVRAAHAEGLDRGRNFFSTGLVGTWFMTVPGATPADTFFAYQTFGGDGTFVETSSLLGALPEGPAHGAWEPRRNGNALTFELFAFDQSLGGAPVGRLRVRALLRLTDEEHLTGDAVLDFIDFDGTVTPDIGTGSFTGEKVKVRPI